MSNTSKPVNTFTATVTVGRDGQTKLARNGSTYAVCRVAVSMGKDVTTGDYKPGLWIEAKAFGDQVNSLARLKKGTRVTLSGALKYDEWTDSDGTRRSALSLLVNSIAPFGVAPEVTPVEEEDCVPF